MRVGMATSLAEMCRWVILDSGENVGMGLCGWQREQDSMEHMTLLRERLFVLTGLS